MNISKTMKASIAPLVLVPVLLCGLSSAAAEEDARTASVAPQVGLTSHQVQTAMGAKRIETRDCVFDTADALPPQVSLTVEIVITPDGLVRTASMYASNAESAEVDACVVEVVSSVEFPSTNLSLDATVHYRLLFVIGSNNR